MKLLDTHTSSIFIMLFRKSVQAVRWRHGVFLLTACDTRSVQLASELARGEYQHCHQLTGSGVHDKRYQVFISSTFEDLRDERRAVQDVIISTGDFPVQMEAFPAADEDQFEFIKSLIDKCDYYVLIIGGRYGTVAEDGLSYTHKEFRYAVSKGVPVLVMLHGDRGSIPSAKSEDTDPGKKHLCDFIAEAESGRLRKTWMSLDGLKLAVREALDHAKATKQRVGWVRGDTIAALDALEELNQVRRENERLRELLGNLEVDVPLPALPEADEPLEFDLLPLIVEKGRFGTKFGSYARIMATWISVFPVFYSNLKWRTNDWDGVNYHNIDDKDSCVSIGSAIAGELGRIDATGLFKIGKNTLDRLSSYYIERGLMTTDGEGPFTPEGHRTARRHRISQDIERAFKLLAGEVKVTSETDDIPF